MTKVRLEIDEVRIDRPKKRWKLYFMVVAEHPTEADKYIVGILPKGGVIKLHPSRNNEFLFHEKDEEGSEGLFVLSREMPDDKHLEVEIYLRHSRQSVRDFGAVLQDLKSGLGGDAFDIVTDIVGTTSPWLIISKKGVSLIGNILSKIKDRDFGVVSASEEFGKEFEKDGEIDRKKPFSGPAELVYTWSVDE